MTFWGPSFTNFLDADSKSLLAALPDNFNFYRCTMSSTGALTLATEASQQQRSVKKVYALSGNLAYGKQKLLFDIAILGWTYPSF